MNADSERGAGLSTLRSTCYGGRGPARFKKARHELHKFTRMKKTLEAEE